MAKPSRSDFLSKKFSLSFFLVAVFFLFFLPVIDTDLGWHLQYGEYFLQHGKFLKENIHSTLLAGYYWPNSYVLYQPLLALVYRWGGLVGLSILGALVLVATFGVVYLYLRRDLLKTMAVAILVWVGGGSVLRLGLRAQVFSLLGCAGLLYLLERTPDSWRKVGLIFLTLMLWANFHGAFAVGVVIVGLWALSRVILTGFSDWKIPLACAVASLVGPMFNPYGAGIYSYAISHLQVPLRDLIAEWVPPVPAYQLASLGLFGIFVYLVSATQSFRNNLFRLAVSSALLFLALSARRNLPLFFLVQGIVLVELFSEVRWPWRWSETVRWGIVLSVVVGGLIYGLAVRSPQTLEASSDRGWCGESRLTRYPCGALEFVREQGITGNVFNNYEWGGFLIW
ncbi:hypothetical protein L6258_00115, partial [Candidatus Parcubacteria bacterium]|nr:hypothetical protein [Candidatus Parcubacteria bacterium]